MEFWGIEVKSGEPVEVEPGDDMVLHLSQACIGEVKKDKGNDSIYLYVNIGDQKVVLGILSSDKFPQISFDLVFEKKFELSHNWKNGSIYFSGYKSPNPIEPDEYSDSDSDEELPLRVASNGRPEAQAKQAKPAAEKANATKPDSAAPKQNVKTVGPSIGEVDDSSDDESESEDEDEDMPNAEPESDDEVDGSDEDEDGDSADSSDEDANIPKKAAPSNKRPADSASKAPVPDKKAKLVTPVKTGAEGKKGGGHVATPHPSKQAGKTPANNDKSKQQSPKSLGSIQCKSCSRSFNSENALQSHTKAKHSAA